MTCQNCKHVNTSWARTCGNCGQLLDHRAGASGSGPSDGNAVALPPVPTADLQLERAEFDNPAQASTCAGCATRGNAAVMETVSTTDPAPTGPVDAESTTTVNPLVAIAILIGFLLALPFLGGIQNIMGLVIIGIGLYEAWKLNCPRVLEITGPHTISTAITIGAQG